MTTIISRIFEVTDDRDKKLLFNELDLLDENTLLEKQKFIEEYFQSINQLTSTYLGKVVQMEHSEQEEQERAEVTLHFNF